MINSVKKILFWIFGLTILSTLITQNDVFARGFGDMIGVDGIHTIGTGEKQNDSLLHTIQTAINRVLGLLSMITLCFILYAGFLMLTSGGDNKKYDSGLTIIKNAAIGLVIIAVSWLIVSLIFFVINGSVSQSIQTN